jgi:hypothetical protein
MGQCMDNMVKVKVNFHRFTSFHFVLQIISGPQKIIPISYKNYTDSIFK